MPFILKEEHKFRQKTENMEFKNYDNQIIQVETMYKSFIFLIMKMKKFK